MRDNGQDIHLHDATAADIVREFFPDANDRTVEFLLWEKTGFPIFWNIGPDGGTPEDCLRTQLNREVERNRHGKTLCKCGTEMEIKAVRCTTCQNRIDAVVDYIHNGGPMPRPDERAA